MNGLNPQPIGCFHQIPIHIWKRLHLQVPGSEAVQVGSQISVMVHRERIWGKLRTPPKYAAFRRAWEAYYF